MAEKSKLIKTVIFNAPRELVWAFLTDKDRLGQWYHPAEADLSEGQSYKLIGKSDDGASKTQIWGRVAEWDRPRRLVTTFCMEPFGDNETTVTWELSEIAGGTRLKLVHEGIAEAAGEAALPLMMALDKGWDIHLSDLRDGTGARAAAAE